LKFNRKFLFGPQAGSSFASEMVLNPAIITEAPAKDSGRIHMLFRSTAPLEGDFTEEKPNPFPIYLGYANSDDCFETWTADFKKAALAPALADTKEDLYIDNINGKSVFNFANGCIEDPRLSWVDGRLLMTVACRTFPPGPYWIKDDPIQCYPNWARRSDHGLGRAVSENLTVSVLYEVELPALSERSYENAFKYISHLTNPEKGDNRDVILFGDKLSISDKKKVGLLHRPWEMKQYFPNENLTPSIVISYADQYEDFALDKAEHKHLMGPLFIWEGNRIGASAPPLKIGNNEWLLCYHGKQDEKIGYTQSFAILAQDANGYIEVTHRCPERLMIAEEAWEMPARFKTPVVFVTGMIRYGSDIVLSYGAADEKVGVATVTYVELVEKIKKYNNKGELTK